MKLASDMPLPFPPDDQQVVLMQTILGDGGVAIASPGTERFDVMDVLAQQGWMDKHFCPAAQGVFQFSVNRAGLEVLQ